MTNTMELDIQPPEGWAMAPLRDLSRPTRPRCDPQEFPNLSYIGMEQVESQTRRLTGTLPAWEMKSTAFHFQAGDVLYGRLRPYLNKVWHADFEGLCSSEFIVLPTTGTFEPKYLSFCLNNGAFVEFANQLNQGDRPRVSYEQIADHLIPLPPLAEQKRIVAKVEELLARVQATRDRLAYVPTIVKHFRQSVLAAACDGRLTAAWREHSEPDASGHTLLERIRRERQAQWERSHPRKQYVQPRQFAGDAPHGIPENWTWCRAEEMSHFITKGTTPPSTQMSASSEIPFIKVYNLAFDGRLHFDINPTFISESTHRSGPLARSIVRPGDVLMNLVGPPLGKVAVVPDLFKEWNCNQAIAIYRPLQGVSPWFLACVLMMGKTLENVIMHAKTTAGQHNLTLEMARDVVLPLPPSLEQEEIVRRVEALFRLADVIERRTANATTRSDKLTQAILAKAFRGELVPTEAELARQERRDYESASVLLDRIRAQKVNDSPSGRRSRRNRRPVAERADRSKVLRVR